MSFIELFWKNGSCAQRPCDSNGVFHKSVRCSVPGKVGVPVSKTAKFICAQTLFFYLNDASCCFIIVFGRFSLGLFELGLLGLRVMFKIERLGLGLLGLGLL